MRVVDVDDDVVDVSLADGLPEEGLLDRLGPDHPQQRNHQQQPTKPRWELGIYKRKILQLEGLGGEGICT